MCSSEPAVDCVLSHRRYIVIGQQELLKRLLLLCLFFGLDKLVCFAAALQDGVVEFRLANLPFPEGFVHHLVPVNFDFPLS